MGLFEVATREKAKLRLALTGVSGAGKSLGALYIAYGLTGDWSKIALIDTEHKRGKFYANRSDLNTGEFMYAELTPPYSPERYKEYVDEATKIVGPDGVVIVDSFSHCWNNEGGVLEIKDKVAQRPGKNSYTAWSEAGKEQNSLVNSILSVNCHTIVTMRSKMDYAMEENDKGKLVPVKVGLAPIQRDDTEYEFDIVLNIARNHIAVASKDTTFLDNFAAVITSELGTQLKDWLDNGTEPERCSDCGKLIVSDGGKSIKTIAAGSLKVYGRKLCLECVRTEARKAKIATEEMKANAGAESVPA